MKAIKNHINKPKGLKTQRNSIQFTQTQKEMQSRNKEAFLKRQSVQINQQAKKSFEGVISPSIIK